MAIFGDFDADEMAAAVRGLTGTAELERAEKRIAELEAALREIEEKYYRIMQDPPDYVTLRLDALTAARNAWNGAALIARKALLQKSR